MTRENKLALVVGFGLILFVGILISDHFSIARTQATANLANQKIADPLVARTRDEPDLIALKPPPPPSQPPQNAPAQPAANPNEFAANTSSLSESMSPEQRSGIDRNVDLASRRGEASAQPGEPRSSGGERVATGIPQHVEPVPSGSPANGNTHVTSVRERDSGEVQIPGFVPVESETTVSAKDLRFHDVRGGESLFSVCKEYYGDTSLTDELAKFNKMDDPSQVRAGRRLVIPPPEVIGGKPVTVAAKSVKDGSRTATPTIDTSVARVQVEKARADKPATAKTRMEKSQDNKPALAKTYTIKAGDSLSSIAQRFLGDREKWRDIHKLNRKIIDDPDNLKVGTIIRLS